MLAGLSIACVELWKQHYCHAGIMMPNISNEETAMKLAVTGKCTCNLKNLPDIPITMMDNKYLLILTANPIYYFVQISTFQCIITLLLNFGYRYAFLTLLIVGTNVFGII